MQGACIAYDTSESLIALGGHQGLIEVSRIAADGSAGSLVWRLFLHKKPVVHLAFTPDARLISVDEGGRIGITSLATGAPERVVEIGGEYVAAATSADGATVFAFAHEGVRDTEVFAIDVATGRVTYGPEVKALRVKTHVLALSATRAAYQCLVERKLTGKEKKAWGDDEKVHEALVFVDFATGHVDVRMFDNGPKNTFGDLPAIAASPAHGFGVRCAYGVPLQLVDHGGKTYVNVNLEVFDLETLASQRIVRAQGALIEDADEIKTIKKGRATSEEYRSIVDTTLDKVSSLALTGDGRFAWVGAPGGLVRRVPLDGSAPSRFVVHGRARERGGFTLDDVFATNVHNNQTIGVSAGGRYVAFGLPNEFLCTDTTDLSGTDPLMLPARVATSSIVPKFAELVGDGSKLVAVTPDGVVMLADVASGAIDFQLAVEYGTNLLSATLSPSGRELVLGYGGRNSLRVRFGGDEPDIVELPLPPHTSFARHIAEGCVVLAHSNGAVVTLEDNTLHAFRHDGDGGCDHDHDDDYNDDDEEDFDDSDEEIPDDEDESDEETPAGIDWQLKNADGVEPLMMVGNYEGVFVYNDYFEQADGLHATEVLELGGVPHVATLFEGGRIEIYKIGSDRIHHASSHRSEYDGGLAAAGGYYVTWNREKGVEVFGVDPARRVLTIKEPMRFAAITADRRVLVFDENAGRVSAIQIDSRRETAILAYEGPAITDATYNLASKRLMIVEADGTMSVVEPDAGRVVSTLCLARTNDAWSIASGKSLGTLRFGGESITRTYPSDDEQREHDARYAQRMALFGHDNETKEQKQLAKKIEKAIERYGKLPDDDRAAQIKLMTSIVEPFERELPELVSSSKDLGTEVGRCFTIRGCARRAIGKVAEATRDFERARAVGYGRGLEELIETMAFHQRDPQRTLELVDRLSIDQAAKAGIGIRNSLPVYRAWIRALLELGDVDRAQHVVRFVTDDLLQYLKDDDDDEKKKTDKPPALHELVNELQGELRTLVAAARPPAYPEKNQANYDRLVALQGRAKFFMTNERWADAISYLDGALAGFGNVTMRPSKPARPVEPTHVLGGATGPRGTTKVPPVGLSDDERFRVGELYGARGRARTKLGDRKGAAADFERAIALREVCHYIDAIDAYLALGQPEPVHRLFDHMRSCPFNWSSEYFDPLKRFDYAYGLAGRAVAHAMAGKPFDVAACRDLYRAELPAVIARLELESARGAAQVITALR